MANGNFDFQLPDGRVIRVEGAPSEEAARSFMDTQWPTLRRQMPIEGFGESFSQQFRGQFGAVPGAAQAGAAAVGSPETAAALGRIRDFVAPGDQNVRTRAPELRDIVRDPISALTAYAGQAAGAVIGGAAAPLALAGIGAAGGAVFGGPGGAAAGAGVGARAGLLGGSVLGSVDELYQGLVAEGVDPQQAGRIAVTAGSAIGAVEGAALLPVLRRITGGQVSEAAIDRIAGRIVGGRAGGIRQTAALGAGGEMAGETARQGVIAATTGNLDLAERATRVGEAGIVGGIAGGGVGTGVRIAGRAGPAPGEPPAPTAPPENAFEPTPPPTPAPEAAAATPPRVAPLVVPERPAAFSTVEEAQSFLAENPRFTPPASLATPEATIGFVNAARLSDWEQSVQQTRRQAITEFFPRAPETNQPLVSDAVSNLAEAANRGDLNLNAFSPGAVAKAALVSRDIDPARVTKAEVKAATDQLDALAEAGVLRKESATKYAVNFGARPEAQPTATPATAPEATAQPAPVPAAAEGAPVPQTPAAPPAPEVAPAPATTVAPEAAPASEALWQGYSTNAGPQAASPPVVAARNIASIRGRPFNRPEFNEFANQIGSAPTPEARDAVANDFVNRPQPAAPAEAARPAAPPAAPAPTPTATATAAPTPTEETLANAAAAAEPASGAGQTTATAEEAVLATPKNYTIKQQQQTLDKQREAMFEGPAEGFRGGIPRKWFASPLTGLARQPEYQRSAEQGTRLADRKLRATTEFTQLYTPMQELSAESQSRAMLTLQEARSRKQMWNRNAFTPEENRAMDNVLAMGQRGLDFYIDAATNKFFNPAEAKTPQDRARLEAFQRAKGDRLITELSDADLRAASDAGAKEVRRLNQRRDKFFFPQVSKGTHFVAAYERQPGGKEKIARIYFYDPLKFAQRQRARVGAQRDFEALAVESLRREFPDTGRFRIMAKGREAENDSRVADLRRDGEFIAQYLQQLNQVSSKESKQILERMAAEINKAQMDRFFRPNNDILRAVTPWNAVDYARETIPNYFLALSNIQGRLLIQDDFNRAMSGYSPEEKRFWNDWLNINSTPVEAFGTGRALAGAWFLGGNISTAMMQLTQNFVTLPARFARDGGLAASTRHMASAARDVYGTADVLRVLGKEMEYTNRLINRGTLSATESAAMKRAALEGVVRPSQITNIRGQFEADTLRSLGVADQSAAKFAAGANKVVDVSFRMLSTVDETNRAVAFLSALRLATANPEVMVRAGRLDNRTYATPYDYARAVVDETNPRGGVDDQPLITRFHPVAQMVTQFLTPSFKFIELFARSGAMAINGLKNSDPVMAKAGALQFALMMAPQVILAGVWALPFADRLKELTEFLLKQAGVQVDLEQEIEKLGVNSLTASTINYGLLHAIGAITLSERLKIDVLPQGSLSEWDIFSVLGPIGGLIEKPTVAHAAWQLGDYWGVGYALLPTSLANVLKGIQIETTGEQYTRRGGRIITPEQVRQAAENGAFPPALQQAIGFAPTEFTNIRRAVQRQRELQDAVRDPTERVNIELSRILLRQYEAQIAGRAEEANARGREFQQRVAEIRAEQQGRPSQLQVQINTQAISQRALQDLQGRGSLEVLLRRAPAAQREEILRMYGRTVNPQ